MSQTCHERTHAPQQTQTYSITSSARKSMEVCTVRPSDLPRFRVDPLQQTRPHGRITKLGLRRGARRVSGWRPETEE